MRFPRLLFGVALVALLLYAFVSFNPQAREQVALLRGQVLYPRITPAPGVTGTVAEDPREVVFERRTFSIVAPAEAAVYEGARDARKSAVHIGQFEGDAWIGDYYRSFALDARQRPMYREILSRLRAIRDREHLDANRYLELTTALVQEIPYHADSFQAPPRFPVETWVDNSGDCDDKSLLVTALLADEGYDVALLYFGPEKHEAIGVKVPGSGYRDTGYAYVEMTTPSLVGDVPDKLGSGKTLSTKPLVIRIGKGTRSYTAEAQVREILRAVARGQARTRELSAQIDASRKTIAETEQSLEAQRAKVNAVAQTGDVAAWRGETAAFNASYSAYRELITRDRSLVDAYNSIVDFERKFVSGQTDRAGLYAYVRTLPW